MKKFFSTFALLVIVAGVSAQDSDAQLIKAPKRHYINLSYATQQLKFAAYDDILATAIKSDYGIAAEFGSTLFFNGKRPVANMIRFGLDFSYLDAQYASFKLDGVNEENQPEILNGHFANIGMQIGLSATVTPVNRVHAKVYVHYAPSLVGFSPSDLGEIKLGYVGYVTGGLQLSYRFLTLGMEMRGATAKLSTVSPDAYEINEDDLGEGEVKAGDVMGPKVKTKLPGLRFTFGFRF